MINWVVVDCINLT